MKFNGLFGKRYSHIVTIVVIIYAVAAIATIVAIVAMRSNLLDSAKRRVAALREIEHIQAAATRPTSITVYLVVSHSPDKEIEQIFLSRENADNYINYYHDSQDYQLEEKVLSQ